MHACITKASSSQVVVGIYVRYVAFGGFVFLFLFIWLFGLFVYIVYFPTPGRIRYIFRNTYSVLASGHMTVFVFVFSPFFFLPESLKRGTDRLVFVGIFQFHDS